MGEIYDLLNYNHKGGELIINFIQRLLRIDINKDVQFVLQ